ncbi:fructoselysine 6-kinase [Petroclostridium sp. X23]|uniref:fructoselysine 6-kinase n=1 Tax=Petroclostridium sp. X23 TaxID=3045146 RepID=UPI0024AE5CF3|nr:fructoselysine 6-kinase [Petroclostridium sp. X23]WHH61622.1 fructoselysine 6-kinase [Petroclostridium sp. X23]
MKTIAVGDNCCDIYLNLNRFYPTGNAIDFAVNLKKLGGDISVLTIFGNDAFAESVRQLLKKYQIDFSMSKSANRQSAEAVMNIVNGDRIHLSYTEHVLSDFYLDEEDIEYIKQFDVIYSEKRSKIGLYAKKIKNDNNIMVHDFSCRLEDQSNNEIIPYMDYAFFSYRKDDDYIRSFLKKARNKGAKVVIAMLGEDGSMAYDGENYYRETAQKVKVLNTVGAGDSYIAGFIYGAMQGEPIEQCMKRGKETATQIIQRFEPY